MTNIKVGIVGSGGFANKHLDNLLTIDGVEVIAIVGRNAEKLEIIGKKVPKARLYSHHKEMFEQEEDLDAVYICVPPNAHSDAEIMAAKRKIHLYVEKPIDLSMDKALATSKAILDAGIISSVGYQERYNWELENIKAYIKQRKVGLVSGRFIGGVPGVYWWRDKDASGGQIVEQSTHIFDMLRFFFGEVTSVYCSAIKGLIQDLPNYTVEDGSSTTITFESGIVATIFSACYIEPMDDYQGVGLQIICHDSIIDYEWNQEVVYTSKTGKNKIPFVGDHHLRASQHFIEAIKTNNPKLIKSTYEDSCKTLELTLAANLSMETKQVVFLNT